jgi:hypothetical protein
MRSTAVISKSFLFPQIPILLFSSSENQRKFESLEFICVLFYLQDRLDFVWSQRLVRCLMTTSTVLTKIAWRTLALECLDCSLSLEFVQVSYEQGWSDSSSWIVVQKKKHVSCTRYILLCGHFLHSKYTKHYYFYWDCDPAGFSRASFNSKGTPES